MDQFTLYVLTALLIYVWMSISLYSISMKLGYKDHAYYAFIPILNIYLITEIARLPWYFMMIFFTVFIPDMPGVVGAVLSLIVIIMAFMNISYSRGFTKWLGVLMLVPGLNVVVVTFLAFSDRKSRINVW